MELELTHYRVDDNDPASVCGDTGLDYETRVLHGGLPVDCAACLALEVTQAQGARERAKGPPVRRYPRFVGRFG